MSEKETRKLMRFSAKIVKPTEKKVRDELLKISKRVAAILPENGVKAENIVSNDVILSQNYAHARANEEPKGFQGTYLLTFSIPNIELVTKILDELVAAGGTSAA